MKEESEKVARVSNEPRHQPAMDDDRVVPTPSLDALHIQHTVHNCSWIAGLSVTGPAEHLEMGHIVNMSTLWEGINKIQLTKRDQVT